MKKIILLCLIMVNIVCLYAQNAQDSLWIRNHYEKKEVYIPMRDGIKLFTSIYSPRDTSEKYPILIIRTPYSCSPYGEDKWRPFWLGFNRYYLREGYIMVLQDVRGRFMSEGEFIDVRPFNPDKKSNSDVDEASDTYDAIDWLIKNISNNNGRAGIKGISYPGFYATMAAMSGHPALKAASPQAPISDWFIGDDWHHNGAFFQMDAFSFYQVIGKPRPQPTTQFPSGFTYSTKDSYKFFLEAGTFGGLSSLMGDSIAFWNDLFQHPDYDEWWKARNIRNFVQNIPESTATLVVGGLFDAEDLFGALRTYEAIEEKAKNNNKLVMGPWYHGQWDSNDGSQLGNVKFGSNTSHWYQNEIELPFFNFYLKDKGNIQSLHEATVFFTGENEWMKFDQWPPANKVDKPIYLNPRGKIDWTKPGGRNSFSEYLSDPSKPVPYTEDVHFNRTISYMTDDQRFAARRPDVLVFQTDVLTEDVTVAGTVIADLMVSISGTDADFVVKLIDVFPEGFSYPGQEITESRLPTKYYMMDSYQMMVRGEIMRGKYRKSFEKPVPFKSGRIEQVKYELPDVAHIFKKGHRIMIQVQSSWFPLVDRNPQKFMNIYTAKEGDFQKATIRIYHDAVNPSRIFLPVIN